jgi:hypothetical protein
MTPLTLGSGVIRPLKRFLPNPRRKLPIFGIQSP